MAVLRSAKGVTFNPAPYENEASFEKDVVALADSIFGDASIYIDMKKRVGTGIKTIPDGYLLDMANPDDPKFFFIENEIVKHHEYRHIGIQILKFAVSYDADKMTVRSFVMKAINENEKQLARLKTACAQSSSPDINHYLDRAVYSGFRCLVIIDEATDDLNELHEVIRKFADADVFELKAYESDDGERTFEFDTLYDDTNEPEEEVAKPLKAENPEEKASSRAARRARRAKADTVVVPAREEGFQNVFLGENEWRAIRIGPAMKDRIKYIAAYRVDPRQEVTHIAKVKDIKLYQDTGRYQLIFDGAAEELKSPVKLKEGAYPPRGPFYVQRQKLVTSKTLDEALAE